MDAEEPNASVTLDLEMPDEEISITLLQNEEHWETLSSEEAVQSAAQEAARVQRSLRESLLQRHGLELSGHLPTTSLYVGSMPASFICSSVFHVGVAEYSRCVCFIGKRQ